MGESMSDVCHRRPGRPKTKFYVTITARIPIALAAQVRHYAEEYHATLSSIVRLGLYAVVVPAQGVSIPIEPGDPEEVDDMPVRPAPGDPSEEEGVLEDISSIPMTNGPWQTVRCWT